MLTLPRWPLALLSGLLSLLPGRALEWNKQNLSIRAEPLQKTAESYFEYTNPGGRTITILSVETNCDCLETSLTSRVIAPGERGRITARFNLGDRHGTYERTITVITDEPGTPVVLRAELTVPLPATLEPRSVEWQLSSPAETQTVNLLVAEGLNLNVHDVQATNPLFSSRVEVVVPGRHYRLKITPTDTGAPANAAIRIFVRAGSGEDLVLSAYANIR